MLPPTSLKRFYTVQHYFYTILFKIVQKIVVNYPHYIDILEGSSQAMELKFPELLSYPIFPTVQKEVLDYFF
jgi:hypothetical protein